MEKNSLQLQGMKISDGSFSARFGLNTMMNSKVGIGYRSTIDWTYPLALDVGVNVFYNPMNKKQILGAGLESSLFVLFDTTDNLPIYFGMGAEITSNSSSTLFHPSAVNVPKFMYKIPMPDPTLTLGKTLMNDAFIELRYSAPFGSIRDGSIGLNYGFGF